MSRRLARISSLGAMAVMFLPGCHPSNPLIGTWRLTQNIFGTPITMTRQFKTDGTESMTAGTSGAMTAEMTYSVEGNTLTETVTSITVGGKTVNTVQPSQNSPKNMTETFLIDANKLTISKSSEGVQTSQIYDRVTQ